MSRSRTYEAEVIPGLEGLAQRELQARFSRRVRSLALHRAGFLRFRYRGSVGELLRLRSVVALYRLHHFSIPRPKAWLGHAHFTKLRDILRAQAAAFSTPPATMGIAAAGTGSSVMRRLQNELAQSLAIPLAADGKGQLFLRLQPDGASGWLALLRISPQPLSKRSYRIHDMPGALNATVAYAMTQLLPLPDAGTALNLCSGTATILIEQALSAAPAQLLALDCNRQALTWGAENARAARLSLPIQGLQADAGHVPLPAQSLDRIYGDLPFGQRIGSHTQNLRLYPALLAEAKRLAKPGAACIFLTQECKLMQRCLRDSHWRLSAEIPIKLSGLHPRLFVLR